MKTELPHADGTRGEDGGGRGAPLETFSRHPKQGSQAVSYGALDLQTPSASSHDLIF